MCARGVGSRNFGIRKNVGVFQVIVQYESENPKHRFPQDHYWHRTPFEAQRRLAALINRKAGWVPARTALGTHFYIMDRTGDKPVRMSLKEFREKYAIKTNDPHSGKGFPNIKYQKKKAQ